MKKFITSIFIILSLLSCNQNDAVMSEKYELVLTDSINLGKKDIHLISVFNQTKITENHTYLIDLLGGQVFGFNEGREVIFDLRPNEIEKIDFAYQPGSLSAHNDNYFVLLPASGRIMHFDKNKRLIKIIMFSSSENLTIDKSASFFNYNYIDSTFYLTLSKETAPLERYKDAPLVGKYSYDGKLLETYSNYPNHYSKIKNIADLNPWKYSFFDSDINSFYAVFNKYNVIYKFDKDFKLMEKLVPELPFIKEELGPGTKIGSFKKHPSKNLFFVNETEYFTTNENIKAVRVKLKWYNSDSGDVGYINMKNFFTLHQITEDGTIIILDRDSYEDAYFYFYKLKEVETG